MIHWFWLLPALFSGALFGTLICALMVAARSQDDIEDLIDRQSGCVCEREAVCSKRTDAA